MTERTQYALRLQASTMEELKKVVAEEGTTINQFINVAVAEKLSALRTADYFKERAAPRGYERILGDFRKGRYRGTAGRG